MSRASEDPDPYQEQVLADLAAILPKDTRSLLDAGCGQGYVARQLSGQSRISGLDRSWERLSQAYGRRVLGDIAAMPFADRAFDLVMANDVLEHLNEQDFRRALQELTRVATKYVVVTVPFMEDLNQGTAQCEACHRYFHVNHHVRSFGLGSLRDLLSDFGWHCRLLILSGDTWQSEPSPIVLMRRLSGLAFANWDQAVCPSCQSTKMRSAKDRAVLNRILDRLALQLSLRDKGTADLRFLRTECIALYSPVGTSRNVDINGRDFIDSAWNAIALQEERRSSVICCAIPPTLHRRSHFIPFAHLPYFLEAESEYGLPFIAPNKPAWIAFCVGKPAGETVQLEIVGEVESWGAIRIWAYDTYKGYHSPVSVHVKGQFRISVPVEGAEMSQYGLVFQLDSEDATIRLQAVSLLNIKGEERVLYDNSLRNARFLRLPGEFPLLLSLPFYGSHIIELEWMRDVNLLWDWTPRSLLADSVPVELRHLLDACVDPIVDECDRLANILQETLADRQRLQEAYDRTFTSRLSRLFRRVRTRVQSTWS